MTKAQIIEEYNNLSHTVKDLYNSYETLTGKEYPEYVSLAFMDSSYMIWSKDDLEQELFNRQFKITKLTNDIKSYNELQKMMSTEDGKNFVDGLKKKGESLKNDLHNLANEFSEKFNNLLKSIDMEDWKLNEMYNDNTPKFKTIYPEIKKEGMKFAELHLTISSAKSKFYMDVNTSMTGPQDVSDRGAQYNRFKGYVNICDHSNEIISWLNTEYREMAKKESEIMLEINKNDEALEDPYDAWNRMMK